MKIRVHQGTLLIGSQTPAGNGEAMASRCPWDNTPLWQGAAASVEQVNQAVVAARAALPQWLHVDRAKCAAAYVTALKSQAQDFARVMALETARPLWETRTEVAAMVAKLDHSLAAQAARRAETRVTTADAVAITHFKPHGVAAVFGPFNMPGHLPNGHIIPALLAGNTIVFKPSEKTPHSGEFMCQLWRQSGLPPGVLNLVQGPASVGEALAQNPDLDAVFFTGSVAVGQALQRLQLQYPHRMLALELGGNNPLVIFNCGDHRAAAYTALTSAFLTAGQRCTCARRLIVGPSDHPVIAELVTMIQSMRIAGPLDTPEPFMGSLISPDAADVVLAAQNRLLSAGGKIVLQASRIAGHDAGLTPGIIDMTDVPNPPDTEIFGPLVQLIRVPDFYSALQEANKTRFGLSAALLSDRRELFQQFYQHVRAGVINWNRPTNGASSALPFGGIGLSGNHRPSGAWAADYCSYPIATMETEKLTAPEKPAPGVSL